MKTNPNDLITPIPDTLYLQGHYNALTKREYFALHAPIKMLVCMYFDRGGGSTYEQAAEVAVKYADALIEELNKKQASDADGDDK